MGTRRRAFFSAHVSAFFFGTSGLWGALALSSANHLAFYRGLIAGIGLLIVLLAQRKSLALPPRLLLRQMLAGVILAVHWQTFFLSTKLGGAAIAAVTFSTFPFFLAYLEPLLFRQKFDGFKVLLSVFLFLGCVLLFPDFDGSENLFLGIWYGLASSLTFACLPLLYKSSVSTASRAKLMLWQMAFASAYASAFVFPDFALAVPIDWLWVMALGVFCTLCAHFLFILALKKISSQSTGMIICMEGAYGTFWGMTVLGETFGARTFLGIAVIIAGSFLAGFYDGRLQGKPDRNAIKPSDGKHG